MTTPRFVIGGPDPVALKANDGRENRVGESELQVVNDNASARGGVVLDARLH